MRQNGESRNKPLYLKLTDFDKGARHFSGERRYMITKDLKRCSTSLVVREMQI